ncbi:MAG: glycosyltransferase family 4 protein [Burkholderiaceae bacterium]|nr:glycosyltransferase family 4 protein [Burkholderiaceae bacterium]
MKVILSVDAISPPLTGIGRYVWELSQRLPQQDGIDRVRYFSHGQWYHDLHARLAQAPAGRSGLRQQLARSRLLVAGWRQLMQHVNGRALANLADHIYHGPGVHLLPFPGKSVATIHDLSVYRCPQYHTRECLDDMRREIPKTLVRADFLIAVSEFTRREVIDHFGWPEDKIRAIPLGVKPQYRPRTPQETQPALAQLGLAHGRYALCIATIEPRKNIDGLLSAYERLPDDLKREYPLVLAGGSGWNNEATLARIARAQAQGWLSYLGYVPETELPLLLAGARSFIFPSFYEGFGLPVLEAMASGVPVVTSNRASLPEVVQGAALLTNPDDIPALTEVIRRSLEDNAWREAAIPASRQVAAGYSWDTTARQTADVYRLLAGA